MSYKYYCGKIICGNNIKEEKNFSENAAKNSKRNRQ